MAYFGIRGQSTGSFLVVSSPLSLFQKKERGENNKETGCLIQLAKVSHDNTTLQFTVYTCMQEAS